MRFELATSRCAKLISFQSLQNVGFRELDGAYLESRPKGIRTAKVIIGLSLILPYLVGWLIEEEFHNFMMYAPTWVVLISEWSTYGGPTPMALLMFVYWIPYVFVGYQSYRFAQGRYSSIGRYIVGVVFVTLVAILFTLSLMNVPMASINEIEYFPTVIPLPLVSILAIVLMPLLRPVGLPSSWDNNKQDVFLQNDSVVTAQDADSQE